MGTVYFAAFPCAQCVVFSLVPHCFRRSGRNDSLLRSEEVPRPWGCWVDRCDLDLAHVKSERWQCMPLTTEYFRFVKYIALTQIADLRICFFGGPVWREGCIHQVGATFKKASNMGLIARSCFLNGFHRLLVRATFGTLGHAKSSWNHRPQKMSQTYENPSSFM